MSSFSQLEKFQTLLQVTIVSLVRYFCIHLKTKTHRSTVPMRNINISKASKYSLDWPTRAQPHKILQNQPIKKKMMVMNWHRPMTKLDRKAWKISKWLSPIRWKKTIENAEAIVPVWKNFELTTDPFIQNFIINGLLFYFTCHDNVCHIPYEDIKTTCCKTK